MGLRVHEWKTYFWPKPYHLCVWVLNQPSLNYLPPLSFHSLSLPPPPRPPLFPPTLSLTSAAHSDGLMEIIQSWKEMKGPGFTGFLSNHIFSSQRRHGSNWGTHFLTLLKGHLLLRQCEHCFSFACWGSFLFYNCSTFPFNNQELYAEFMPVIPSF